MSPKPMPRGLTRWLLALLLAVNCRAAGANDLCLVCHAGLSVAAADFRDIFLGEKQYASAVRLVPVDNAAAQAIFLDKVLNMSEVRYTNAWARKSFRDGINPPAALANDTAVLDFLRRTPGACGYLINEPQDSVAVIGTY